MSADKTQVLVAAYADEGAARKAYNSLLRARDKGRFAVESAAVVRKDAGGKLRIRESDDFSPGRGARLGALVGGAAGLLGGLPGVLLGAGFGALVGGLYTRWRDTGMPDERLRALGDTLDLGDSAIVAIVGEDDLAEVAEILDEIALRVTNASISADMSSPIFAAEGAEIIASAEEEEAQAIVIVEETRTADAGDAALVDDLQAIDGIGPTYAQRLQAAGITSFAELAALDPAQLMAITKLRSADSAAAWIAAAQARL